MNCDLFVEKHGTEKRSKFNGEYLRDFLKLDRWEEERLRVEYWNEAPNPNVQEPPFGISREEWERLEVESMISQRSYGRWVESCKRMGEHDSALMYKA
jgi:hypothetical protein